MPGKNPDDRYQCVSDLLADLESLKNNQSPKFANEKSSNSDVVSKLNHYPVKAQLENSVLYAGIIAFTLFFCYLANTVYSNFESNVSTKISKKKSHSSNKFRTKPNVKDFFVKDQALEYLTNIEPEIDKENSEDKVFSKRRTYSSNSNFSDWEIKNKLPGIWNYQLYGKDGKFVITKSRVVNGKRLFSGYFDNGSNEIRIHGFLSSKDDSLKLVSETGMIIPEGTKLHTMPNQKLEFRFKDSSKFGFYARQQVTQKIPDSMFEKKIDKESKMYVGNWRSLMNDTKPSDSFSIIEDHARRILRIENNQDNKNLGSIIIGADDNVIVQYGDTLKAMKVWYDSDLGGLAIGVEGVPIFLKSN